VAEIALTFRYPRVRMRISSTPVPPALPSLTRENDEMDDIFFVAIITFTSAATTLETLKVLGGVG